jgi:hypothetical protein
MGKIKIVKPIELNADGEIVFNLSSDAANADWLRAARLLEQGKVIEFEKLSKTKMVYWEDDEENKKP